MRIVGLIICWFCVSCVAQKGHLKDHEEDFFTLLPKYNVVEDTIKVRTKVVSSNPSYDFRFDNMKSRAISAKMDTLIKSYQSIKLAQGYRVQVYFGDSKDEVRKAKESVYAILPDVEIYSSYKQPDYRVKVGDFLTKVEAFSCLGKLEKTFPNAVIVPDVVNLKK